MPELIDTLRANIEAELRRKGWVWKDLGERMKMSSSQLSQIMTARNSPTLKIVERMSEALGVSVARLLATPSDLAQFEHDVHECHRRVGERLKRPEAMTLEEIARAVHSVTDETFAEIAKARKGGSKKKSG